MATPFPNAYGGFTEGLLGGFNAMNSALAQKRQSDIAQQTADKENKKAAYEQDMKTSEFLLRVQGDPNTSEADSIKAHNALVPIVNKNFNAGWTPVDTWSPEFTKAAKQASNILADKNYSEQDKLSLIQGIYNETSSAARERMQPMLNQAQKSSESANLSAAGLLSQPLSQTDPAQMNAIQSAYAANPGLLNGLTPEQAISQNIDTRKLGYLQNAGKSGEEVIKKQIEEAMRPQNQTEEQLTARALNGDTEAQSILDRIQERKMKLVEATGKARADATGKDFRQESSMRKEFLDLPEVKQYPVIEQQAGRALKALSDPYKNKVAVDQSIITTFNKMLDPSSVVRESEYARTPQDMALLNRIKGKWDKLSTGGAGITDDERQTMSRMIKAFKSVADDQYNEQVKYYTNLSKRYGYDPKNVVRLGGKTQSVISSAETRPPLSSFGGK